MTDRARALWIMLAAYLVAIAVGFVVLLLVEGHPLWRAFVADVAATVTIFVFSRVYKNSSFYDAYWSVIPPLLGAYWLWAAEDGGPRAWLVMALVIFWAVRLTWNWASHWEGLHHEDWRYPMVRSKYPRYEFLIDFSGIHFFPTVQVFICCLPLYAAVTYGSGPLGWLDYVAALVTFSAVMIEMIADIQLHRFIRNKKPGEFIRSGLWAWSRHPNYFGETAFWWGLALFGLAAYPAGWWWILPGAFCMTAMFVFASIPMMDKRSVERRPAYAQFMREVSALVPLPPRKG
jgi:steroid 5-alpha reductase family enzyme